MNSLLLEPQKQEIKLNVLNHLNGNDNTIRTFVPLLFRYFVLFKVKGENCYINKEVTHRILLTHFLKYYLVDLL